MPVYQRIDPNLCSAWINRELQANTVLQSLVKGRFYKGDAVPTPEEGLKYPLIYWTGAAIDSTALYDNGRETLCRRESRYTVRVQQRFDGRPAGNWDSEFYHQLRASLTGIKATEVVVGGVIIGPIWNAWLVQDYTDAHRDGEARVLESGITIGISHL